MDPVTDGAANDPGSERGFELPRRLGPLRLLQRLGSGGMGTVYEAVVEDACDGVPAGTRVAVKILRADRGGAGHGAERLRREARLGAR